ncbi:MAG: glycosyltransferase family 9 protein [Bacteroidetes bacterium]|nr:glycosyltransferase family 9 protein [Bacteroidota bacterium]MBS1929598.1 glycosyltransferase family 9 protein [Bacteroidota bacterium]
MKFLIIRLSSIGDIVLTTPVIRCLKKQVKGAEIHFLVKRAFYPVIQHNPYIDKIHVLDHSLELIMHELNDENFDYIIDLHHNIRTLQIKNRLQKKSFSFHKLNIEKYLYTGFKINILPDIHIVDRYLKTVESFGVKNDGAGLDYFIGTQGGIGKDDIPISHSAGFISCVIGAAHGTKKLPVHKWKEFCERINHPVLLLGGKQDAGMADEIVSVDPIKIYNACGKFSINESAELVRRSIVIVSNDTGLMHIAAAFKKPVVSLWGNTVPSFGMYPYYGEKFLVVQQEIPYSILQVKKLWCRPCSKIGYKKCPLGHFKCMEKIKTEDIISAVQKWLK